MTGQAIYNRRNQDVVDRGLRPGVSTRGVRGACRSPTYPRARDRVGGDQAGPSNCSRSRPTKRRFEVVAAVAADGYPVEVARRVVGVSVSGYYCWRRRPPAERSVRHAMLLGCASCVAGVHETDLVADTRCRLVGEAFLGPGESTFRGDAGITAWAPSGWTDRAVRSRRAGLGWTNRPTLKSSPP